MIRPEDLASLRTAAPDYAETERLKDWLAGLRRTRKPLYLTRNELEPIYVWKLRDQYGRQKELRDSNTDSAYVTVSQAALSVHEGDWDYEAELRLGILTSLRGVAVPVASAILALAEPDRYCVIDFRGWRAVVGEEKQGFSIRDYKRYLAAVRELADQLQWPVQEVDLAIWEYDRGRHGTTT